MRSDEDIRSAMGRHADTVRRLCVVYLRSYADTEDVFQTVFVRYARREEPFESPEHENAHCHGVSADEVAGAREVGLSYGKYRLLLEIQRLDPSVTADDVRDLPMREMVDLLESLGGSDAGSTGSGAEGGVGAGAAPGGGHGHASRYGGHHGGRVD